MGLHVCEKRKEHAMPQTKDWRNMVEWSARLLKQRTGEDVAAWNRRIARGKFPDEKNLRAWLTKQGVSSYPQSLLVWETFGYPEHMLASAGQLIDGQYSDRQNLRPILD